MESLKKSAKAAKYATPQENVEDAIEAEQRQTAKSTQKTFSKLGRHDNKQEKK